MHLERGRLDAGLLRVRGVVHVGAVAVALGPAQVHPHEHLGEVGGVHPAGLGADRHQRLALVVLARQQRAHLERLDVVAQLDALGVGVGDGRGVALVLGELVEHGEVLEPAPQVLHPPQLALRVREAARDLLRGFGVVPEIGLACLVREVGDLGAQPGHVGDRLDALEGGREVLEVGCDVGVHNAPGYARVPTSSYGMASSSFSIARDVRHGEVGDGLPVRIGLAARDRPGRVQPRGVGLPAGVHQLGALLLGERPGVQQPQHERAAQRVGPAARRQPRLERALPRRGDRVLLRRPRPLRPQPDQPGLGERRQLAVDLAARHGEEGAELLHGRG